MYLKVNLYTKRYLSTDNLSTILWWVDVSFGVHWNSKGHAGAMMSMETGAIINIERKHKMIVTSSTDSELVSKYRQCPGYDVMVQVLHGSTGVHDREQYSVPRQHIDHPSGKEREAVGW